MSEKIKITVVVHVEKVNTEKTAGTERNIILTQDTSMTLMSVLVKNRLMDGSFCGGRGDCGRCVVQFLKGTPLPTGVERARLTPEELRQGYRLACMIRPKADCVIRIVATEENESEIVTKMMLQSEKIDLYSRKKNLSENHKADAMESDMNKRKELKDNSSYIIAVDLGTTTIAMQLRDVKNGEVADTYCEKNPQRIYGADVLARIQASCAGSREELRRLVCETLLRGLGQFAEYLREKEVAHSPVDKADSAYDFKRIVCMCIAGNTTMEHLLMGYDVETLGKAPFLPVETGLQEVGTARIFAEMMHLPVGTMTMTGMVELDFPVYITPCISAFVGGDIVAGLYALRMLPAPAGRVVLLIDLGTNGEMAITDGNRMIVTATAAGPAFEGDGTLIGTDRIAFTAELLQRGVLDETGLLEEPYFTDGVCIETGINSTSEEKNVCHFKQEDVRSLQMAKAAVRAGVEILWEEMGRPEIGQVYLAGGFGYYLDVEAAFSIGLLPSGMRGKVFSTGNTSLAGAYELGRDLWRGELKAAVLEEKLSSIISVNLARREGFEGLYLKYMNLESSGDMSSIS